MVLILFTILLDYPFFLLMSSQFQCFKDSTSRENGFLLYCVSPVNAMAVISCSFHYYLLYVILIVGYLRNQSKGIAFVCLLCGCYLDPLLWILVVLFYIPSLFLWISPILLTILLSTDQVIVYSELYV